MALCLYTSQGLCWHTPLICTYGLLACPAANIRDGGSWLALSHCIALCRFNTAGRSIKTGLTAAVIVSQWTWAATLLQSSNVAWKYGVSGMWQPTSLYCGPVARGASVWPAHVGLAFLRIEPAPTQATFPAGPFWYAAGATIQVLLFAILAIEVKLKAPRAHTILEIIRARWGTAAHLVFMFFCFCTNILVSSMLILGGAAVVNALTGVDLYAASFLIPVGVILYTAAGGLKATFMASYIHTAILYIALVIFTFKIYASSEPGVGSPGKVC
jgi:urea-proton symporter